MCEILIRDGKHIFYAYDIKDEHRVGEEGFKASKELVREFQYEVEYHNSDNTEGLCTDCIDWHKDMKNRCRGCEMLFKNDRSHYKENGNYCGRCSDISIIDHEPETSNDRP